MSDSYTVDATFDPREPVRFESVAVPYQLPSACISVSVDAVPVTPRAAGPSPQGSFTVSVPTEPRA